MCNKVFNCLRRGAVQDNKLGVLMQHFSVIGGDQGPDVAALNRPGLRPHT